MRSEDYTNGITEVLTRFVAAVKIKSDLNYTDVNREAQNVLTRLFRVIFKYHNLRNLDISEHQNFPGIDLADDKARVTFQITSDRTSGKVKRLWRNSTNTIFMRNMIGWLYTF